MEKDDFKYSLSFGEDVFGGPRWCELVSETDAIRYRENGTVPVMLDTEGWPIKRIDPTLRALFRAAGAEMLEQKGTNPKVVISEFVDVAKAFFPEGKEPGLVNAVLDKMARGARPEAFV